MEVQNQHVKLLLLNNSQPKIILIERQHHFKMTMTMKNILNKQEKLLQIKQLIIKMTMIKIPSPIISISNRAANCNRQETFLMKKT